MFDGVGAACLLAAHSLFACCMLAITGALMVTHHWSASRRPFLFLCPLQVSLDVVHTICHPSLNNQSIILDPRFEALKRARNLCTVWFIVHRRRHSGRGSSNQHPYHTGCTSMCPHLLILLYLLYYLLYCTYLPVEYCQPCRHRIY